MSEENNEPKFDPATTQPIKKTSAVPLRKETVRVTLKAPGARPGVIPAGVEPAPVPSPSFGGAPAPMNSSSISQTAQLTPPSTMQLTPPATSKLDIPDVTSAVPLKQETMRVTLKADRNGAPVAPAPTIPLAGAVRPVTLATPAPTMRLGGAPTVALATQPLIKPIASQPLPKATVELQKTQQLGQGASGQGQAPLINRFNENDEYAAESAGPALPLSIISFVLSLVVLWFQYQHSKVWVDEHHNGDWAAVFDTTAK